MESWIGTLALVETVEFDEVWSTLGLYLYYNDQVGSRVGWECHALHRCQIV